MDNTEKQLESARESVREIILKQTWGADLESVLKSVIALAP